MLARLWLCLLAAALGLAAWAVEPDGPYVVRGANGFEALSITVEDGAAQRQSKPVVKGDSLTIPAVGKVPAFTVTLREPAAVAPDAIKVPASTPLFVMADTHGEFEIVVSQLRQHGVIGADMRWAFGRGRLIVLGDVFDRGPNQLEILWLLYQLEAEAEKAGGGVHLVIGNHETMVLRGDQRYLHRKYVETLRTLGLRSYSALFDAESLLGQWLRTRPTMFKVNDLLCLHGGVSRALVDTGMTLPEINATMRALLLPSPPLNETDLKRAELLFGSLGPLWYRGYFPGHADYPAATDEDVAAALKAYGVKRILVGHTIVPAITSLYEGKVIAVQVYPKRDEAGVANFESLLVKGNVFRRARLDGSVEPLRLKVTGR
jgi:hypothetical protein